MNESIEICPQSPTGNVVPLRRAACNGHPIGALGSSEMHIYSSANICYKALVVDIKNPTPESTTISKALLDIILNSKGIEEYAQQLLDKLLTIHGFCYQPQCSLFLFNKTSRTLVSVAHKGTWLSDDCMKKQSTDCPLHIAARNGEISVLNKKLCPEDCTCDCHSNLHIVPLKTQTTTVGLLLISLSKSGACDSYKFKFLMDIAGTIARSLDLFLDIAKKDRMVSIVHETPSPVLECSFDGTVLYANPSLKKLLWQYSMELADLLPDNHIDCIRSCIQIEGSETVKNQVEEHHFSWTYHYSPKTKKVHVFGVDVSEQHRIESQLAHDAMHDALTELPNRNHLLSILKGQLSIIKRREDYTFALIILDLNRFKTVIESMGFSAGNLVLKHIAQRLKHTQTTERFIARMGGDEFAVVVEDVDNISAVLEIASLFNNAISQPIAVRENNISLTACVGIAIGNTTSQTAESILHNASAAVYRAKRNGPGSIEVYDKEMHVDALARLRVHNELTSAMETGDLTVYYQPVFGLKDMRLRGFEALARWKHPEKGLLGPSEFIPIAEETGLIQDVGAYVFSTVCRQLAQWKKGNLPLAWVSVNLSAHQFKLDTLVEDLMKSVTEAGADPTRLFVEITEGTAAESPEQAFHMMNALKEHGIRIALDDFGTGYSSMAYLKRFPIDTLKLDRSFIKGLPESQDDAAIAGTVIAMAKSLGMKVVAEGVEDERQALFLRSRNCDEVQGFLYGKPMPARNATAVLKTSAQKTASIKTKIREVKLRLET